MQTFYFCYVQCADDVRNEMDGGHQIDIVYPLLLQGEDAVGQHLLGDGLAHALTADLAVLAEDTAKITARKEDGTRASRSADGGLLPEVGGDTGNAEAVRHTAYAKLSRGAVNTASAGAQKAMGEELFGPPAEGRENVPAGSSDPRVAALAERMVAREGPVWLMNHCKAHFQTTDKVLEACGSSRAALPPEGQVTSAVKNGDYKNA